MNRLPLSQHLQALLNTVIIIAAGYLAKKGVDADSAQLIASSIILAGVAYGVAWIQRTKLFVSLPPSLQDAITSINQPADSTPNGIAPSPTPTKTVVRGVVLLLASASAIGLIGCANMTPDQRLAAADQALITAETTLKIAVDDRIITDPKTLRVIDVTTQAANSALAKAHQLRATTQPTDNVLFWIEQAEQLIPQINAFYQQNAKEKSSCLWPPSSPSLPQLRKRSGQLETASSDWLSWPGRLAAA